MAISEVTRYTPQKQQERISRHQLCERLEKLGWIASRPDEDLGEDFLVHIYLQGKATGVTFHIQLKSVTNLNERRKGDYLLYDFEVKDLKHWETFSLPVVLIVWDIKLREGRWALIDEMIFDLDQRLPKWRTNKSKARGHIPWDNTTDDVGMIWLRQNIGHRVFPLIAKDRPLEIKSLELRYPDTPEAKATQTAFERFLKEGEPVIIKGKFLQKFELSEWWMRWFGEYNLDNIEVTIGPRTSSKTFPVGIDMIGTDSKIVSIPYAELRVIKAGQEMVTFSNEHQNSLLHFRLSFQEPDQYTLSYKINWGSNVCITRDVMRFLSAMDTGGTLRLTFFTLDNASLDIPVLVQPEKFSDLTPELLQTIDKLCTIQNKTGQFLILSSGSGIDVRKVDKLVSIIEWGQAAWKPKEEIKLDKKTLEVLLDIHRQGKRIYLSFAKNESYVELLGQKIQTGRITRCLSGRIEISVTEMEKVVASLASGEYFPIRFADVEAVEIYPDWFIREAQRLSQLLVEKFSIEAVYLFGSLVWNNVHAPETDIDLAVSGLPSARYFEAVSYLEGESKFPIDLVELSKVSDHLRQRILTEGKLLHEREPVAAFD